MRLSTKNLEQAAATQRDPRWASVLARSPAADGSFFYSVRTTGVYCRPSCAARLARPENVRFHMTRQEAEQAGFRPCRRCKPDQPSLTEQHTAMVTEACRLIEASEGIPSLETAGDARWHERIPLPPDLQGHHGPDTKRVRDCTARRAHAR